MGVTGLGVFSQFSTVINLLGFFLPLGFPLGITKIVAQNLNSDKVKIQQLLKSVLIVVSFPIIVSVLLLNLFAEDLSLWFFSDSSYRRYFNLISIFLPIIAIYYLIESYIKGTSNISLYVKSMIYSSIISLIISVPLVIFLSIKGAILGVLLNFIVFSIYVFIKIRKNSLLSLSLFRSKFSIDSIKEVLKIGIAFLIVGSLHQITILYLKGITIDKFGLAGNGIFQSTLSISLIYFGFIFVSLSSYSFPKISKINSDSELIKEMNNTLKFILLIMLPLVLFLIVYKEYIILILYTSDFLDAKSLFYFQFVGDFFRAVSWVLGIWLIPRSKIFYFVLLDVILNFNLVFFYKLFISTTDYNLTSVSLAYLSAYIIHFLLNFILVKKIIGFNFSKRNFKLLIVSILILVFFIFFSHHNALLMCIVYIPTVALWIYISVNKYELNEAMIIVKNYFK